MTESFRWDRWAAPKSPDVKFDHNASMTDDDLFDFVKKRDRSLPRWLPAACQRTTTDEQWCDTTSSTPTIECDSSSLNGSRKDNPPVAGYD